MKRIFMLAGPNGAGKTTMAAILMANYKMIYEYINADEIARGLAPLHPESVALAASKLMLKRVRELLDENNSFAFETTAAGTNYLKYLREAKRKEYQINLLYLWLSSPDQAVKRVAERVSQGGHNIPENTVRRRYFTGIKNLLNLYLPLVDRALILDNSLQESKIIARMDITHSLRIVDQGIWKEMQRLANV